MNIHLYLCPKLLCMRTRDIDKEQLVKKTAIKMLVDIGFEGFSMNKLAKACGISVATLYIYYNDKDDLIKKIGIEIGQKFFATATRNFNTDMSFEEGLRKQWDNRIAFAMDNILETKCYEVIRHSPHADYVLEHSYGQFGEKMREFCQNAIAKKQLIPLSFEVFWSIAYGPLYNMIRFHSEGKSVCGRPFVFSEEQKDEALAIVIKALTP